MPIVEIHGQKVHIDSDSHSAKYAADYLDKLDKGEADNFFEKARNDNYSHFETPKHETNKDLHHNMTLEHGDDGVYYLRKRA